MNTKNLSKFLFALLCASGGVHAAPFTIRTVPSGLDSAPQVPVAADFNGDGKLSWYGGGNVISHFPRPGTITLPVMTLPGTVNTTVIPMQAAAFDVDGDGDIDIVRINQWQGQSKARTLQVFINNGSGSFTLGYRSDWTAPAYDTGEERYRFNVADYDLDGDLDLALLNTYQYPNHAFSPPAMKVRCGFFGMSERISTLPPTSSPFILTMRPISLQRTRMVMGTLI